MSTARRKREQSRLCRRLARLASDGEVKKRLIDAANNYLAEAARSEAALEEEKLRAEDAPGHQLAPNLAYD